MKKMIMISVALLAFIATQAMAEGMGHHGGMHHMLKHADTNHDGKITKAEFLAASRQRAEKHFAHMDANHDGVVDEKDHQVYFDQMDANHDGSISRDEFSAFHKQMRNKHHKKGTCDE